MNAYELADELENKINLSENLFVFDAANMLRQQADRIAELENKLSFYEIKDLDSGLKPKPLSDEEIQALWTVKHPNVMSLNPDLLEFARAIEERHGIK